MTNHQKTWHRGVHTHFIPPVVLLTWLSSMSSHGTCPVSYPMASMGWDIYPSAKFMWSCRHSHPLYITWSPHLFSVDAPVDVHGKSCSFPFIHPGEVFLTRCWAITRPSSSCGVVSLSLPLGVGLTGSQLWCRMHDCLCWSVTLYEGMCVVIWCTT